MNNFVKDSYEQIVKVKSSGDYEQARWFATPIRRAGYAMTKQTISKRAIKALPKFADYLELGPGPGTWTKLFLEKAVNAQYDLVDISEEMLNLARQSLSQYKNIRFFTVDFLEFLPDKKYDYFFSSRAIEYIDDKEIAVKKIADCLRTGGEGFIITKMPKYVRQRLLQRELAPLHRNQITPNYLQKLLQRNNCQTISIYPATVSIPLFHSASLNKMAYTCLSKLPLNFFAQLLTESYAIKFKKL